MLSILNHYQRSRKNTEKIVKGLTKTSTVSLDLAINNLRELNILFAASLPFTIHFETGAIININSFLLERKAFDNTFIRMAIGHNNDTFKYLITEFIIKEAQQLQ